jgi:hypothetical protein
VRFVEGAQIPASTGAAQTMLFGARLELCPLHVGQRRLGARVCALGEGGALRAVGLRLPDATASTAPWIAAGALARVEWNVGGPWILEAEGGAIVPIVRENVVVGPPSVVVYQVPGFGGIGEAGIGLRFP